MGDTVELIDGKGALAHARILKLAKDSVELEVQSLVQDKPPPFEIILAQAIPRQNRLDIILEKGTELGFTKLWLFPGMLSEKKSVNLTRAKKILVAATKQCGRLFLPEVEMKAPLKDWKKLDFSCYYGDTDPEAPPLLSLLQKPEKGILFFIGPEQGFHSQEAHILKELGVRGVKLHPNILRTDTAPLCALSLIAQLLIRESFNFH